MKEHFLDRLYGEYQAYRASLLSCPNIEIFNRCYEIDAVVNFYEILMEKIVEWTVAYRDGEDIAETMDRQIREFLCCGV